MTLSISWSTSEQRSDGATMDSVSVEHVLAFDAVTSETHDTGSTITESPVEAGAPISDHKRPLQRRLSIEAVVTNTPIGRVPDSGDGSGEIAFSEQKSEGAGAVVRVYTTSFDRMTSVLSVLDRLATEAIAVTITTRVRTYEALQIRSVSAPRKSDDGDSITFQIEAVEIRIVEALRVDIPDPLEPRGQRGVDAGAQATTEAPPESTAHRAGRELLAALGY